MNTWDLSSDTLNFLQQRGILDKLSNKPPAYGGSMEYLKAFDGSNYTSGTGPDGVVTDADAARVKDAGYHLAIIQALIPPPGYPHAGEATYPSQLAAVFSDAGLAIDGYLYWLPGATPFAQKIATLSGVRVRQWWVDLEERIATLVGSELSQSVRSALQSADAAPSTLGAPAGVYTASWWLQWYEQSGGDMSIFAGRKLWYAAWDGVVDPTLNGNVPGNMILAIKQFAGTSSIAGVNGVDLNVLTTEEGSSLDVNVPEVPADYQTKFALSGPYDWPGVAANLEGIIHELQGEVQSAKQSHAGDTDTHALTDTLAHILESHGYTVTESAPSA